MCLGKKGRGVGREERLKCRMTLEEPSDRLMKGWVFCLLVVGKELHIEQGLPEHGLCAKSLVGTMR